MWEELIAGVQNGAATPQPQNLGNPMQGQSTPPGGMDAAVNGLPGGLMIGPPKSPEEMAQRGSQWSQVLDQITKDPDMMSTLMYMGTQMMQPLQPGQTVGGQLGQTAAKGMEYLGGKQELARKRGMEDRTLGMEERKTDASIRSSDASARNSTASAAQTEAENAEFARTQNQRDRKREQELAKLEGDIENNRDAKSLNTINRRISLMEEELKITERSEFMSPTAVKQRARLNELKVTTEELKNKLTKAQTAAAGRQGVEKPEKPSATEQMIEDYVRDETWPPALGITNERTRRRLAQDHVGKKVAGSEPAAVGELKFVMEELRKLGYPSEKLYEYANMSMLGEPIPPPSSGAAAPTAGATPYGAPVKLKTWADRDKLVKPGQPYIGPDGKPYKRPL